MEEWDKKKLKELASFYSGGTPLTSKRKYYNGEIPFIRSGEIDSIFTEQFITEDGLRNSSAKMVETGDILYALYGATSGEVAISKIAGAINQAILCIRSTQDHYYIYTYLLLKKDTIIKSFLQGGQGNLSAEIIKKLPIHIPSLLEQQKIASFVTAIDQKISQLKQKKTLLEQYKKGVMQKIFSQKIRFRDDNGQEFPMWEKKKLGDIGDFKNGINKGKEDFGFGIPFINLMDVFGKPIISNSELDLVNATEKEVELYALKKGDVLFIRSSVKREGVGETSLVLEDLNNIVYSGFLIRFRDTKISLSLKFKIYCFSNSLFRKKLISMSTTSANTNINQESLSELIIEIPCTEEQTKIANFLSSIDDKINHIQNQIEKAELWKKGLLQKMFV